MAGPARAHPPNPTWFLAATDAPRVGRAAREFRKVVDARAPVDAAALRATLEGFGFPPLAGIDPNPANEVGAAILHTAHGQFGLLLRVEPNADEQQLRITLRSPSDEVSALVGELLARQF
jgi:hypothetical protein